MKRAKDRQKANQGVLEEPNCTLLDHLVGAGKKRWRHREAERLVVVSSMTRSNFVEARRMRVCYPSRPSARMVSCTFGLAPIRAMYALMFGHFARSLIELAHRLSSEITHMPTCAVAEFTFSAKSWSNIGKAKLAKVALDYPKKSKCKASRQ
jgi:hypothetical protein